MICCTWLCALLLQAAPTCPHLLSWAVVPVRPEHYSLLLLVPCQVGLTAGFVVEEVGKGQQHHLATLVI
jgi:hypothetical protein